MKVNKQKYNHVANFYIISHIDTMDERDSNMLSCARCNNSFFDEPYSMQNLLSAALAIFEHALSS